MWRTVAVVMCAALPVSFYVLGDLMDAFPGVLTVRSAEEDPGSGPRAVAEDWERVDPAEAVAPVGSSPSPVDPADLQQRMAAKAELPVGGGGLAFSVVAAEDGDRTSVGMKVTGTNGAVYPVSYTLEKVGGEWKVRNVIVNGINIGKLFRDQFADSMQKNRNDLEKTIAGWGQVVAKAKDAAKGQPEGSAE